MASMFNSKEIYKRLPKVKPDENPLRSIKGLYISGEWKPAYWIDESIHLSDIKTSKAIITTLYAKDFNMPYDNILTFNDFTVNDYSVIDYSVKSDNLPYDNILTFNDFTVNDYSIIDYTTVTNDLPCDNILSLTNIDFSNDIELISYTNIHYETKENITLHLIGISTTQSTIT